METPRETSPYFLVQERFRDDPWKLLVCCILLNQTSGKSALPVWEALFERWPSAEDFRLASLFPDDCAEMLDVIRPLGLQNRRLQNLIGMSFDYDIVHPENDTDRVRELRGVGKYASDSFRMFVGGRIVEDVDDKELKKYVQWARERSVAR